MENELLTYGELKKRLKMPVDRSLLSHKKAGGADIAFLNITFVKDLLDARLAPNHWEALVKSTTVCGDNLLMIVSLIIHASDGSFCQDGTGIESLSVRGYGDTGSNAFSQGLRRAAESHGFCRELWRDGLSAEQVEIQKESAKPPAAATPNKDLPIATRIRNIETAINKLGGKDAPVLTTGRTEGELLEEFATLVEQYKRLEARAK